MHRTGRAHLTAQGEAPGPLQLASGLFTAFWGGRVGLSTGCCSPAGWRLSPSCGYRAALHGAGRDPRAAFWSDSTQMRKLSIPPFKQNMSKLSLLQNGSTSDQTEAFHVR